ncbi:MAG TPA: ribonuclease III domain-containing protein [Candidatus Limiplasma sp.]|jgi:ribonuclease-3 family protein|nr:ribonuclease III domain-containing protein [Candidatus Limiplasma sp.]HPR79540.1 ribonuclease III domain-containing protein [Candidatus Limiplasma sp.]
MEEWGLAREPMSDKDAELKNPLTLAFIGDTVWDLLVRQALLDTSARVNTLHRRATAVVNAGAQSRALERLEPLLEEPEKAIVRRGFNAHCGHVTPRNQDPVDYRRATGLEALLGWLYLCGKRERLTELFTAAFPAGVPEISPTGWKTTL